MRRLPLELKDERCGRLLVLLSYLAERGAGAPGHVRLPEEVLRRAGVPDADLRTLARGGFFAHEPSASQEAIAGPCFTLGPAGAAWAEELLRELVAGQGPPFRGKPALRWDRSERELKYGEEVLKTVSALATVEEILLDALEAAGWPQYPATLPDPLPRAVREGKLRPSRNPKRRLRDGVRSLKAGLRGRVLTFLVDDCSRRFGYKLL